MARARSAIALRAAGQPTNRKRVQRLMRIMGLEALVPKPGTSRPAPDHPVYPYLLRNIDISRVNHVWASDITYIPMAHGFIYLVAIIDWYSRRVLSWRLSNTMDTDFCVRALQDALAEFGAPEIFNTDQGAQFTAEAFTTPLRERGIKISMDGKGRCIDNVFVERVWRSLKYEEVYLTRTTTCRKLAFASVVILNFTMESDRTNRWDIRRRRLSTTASCRNGLRESRVFSTPFSTSFLTTCPSPPRPPSDR